MNHIPFFYSQWGLNNMLRLIYIIKSDLDLVNSRLSYIGYPFTVAFWSCFLFDAFPERATDGSLQSEDWALNMEICDIINETEDG